MASREATCCVLSTSIRSAPSACRSLSPHRGGVAGQALQSKPHKLLLEAVFAQPAPNFVTTHPSCSCSCSQVGGVRHARASSACVRAAMVPVPTTGRGSPAACETVQEERTERAMRERYTTPSLPRAPSCSACVAALRPRKPVTCVAPRSGRRSGLAARALLHWRTFGGY